MNGRHDSSSSRGKPHRTDPVLGNLDQLDADAGGRPGGRRPAPEPQPQSPPPPPFSTHSRHEAPPPRRRKAWLWVAIALLVLVLVGGWAWSNQAMLRGLLPQTRMNALLTRADAALAAGHLSGGPDSARDLYGAARALDPDNDLARNGLQKVGKAELERARKALEQRDYTRARASLEEARSLLGGGAGVDALDKALAKAVLKSANIDVLIGQAQDALAHGRIDGSNGAAALFGKVLAGDPHNAVARHGMDKVGDALAAKISDQLARNDRTGAHETLTRLAGLVPRYAKLPTLRASVAAADRAADDRRDQYLAQAEADLRSGKITGASDDNALAGFKAALALDPDNARAQAGLGKVAEALVVQASAAMDAGQRGEAKRLLDQAVALAPKSADVAAARSRLGAGTNAGPGEASSSQPPAAPVSPAQSAQVARLVARARAAARKGDIMLPPGESAYDLYRAALGIDGDNPQALAGLQALPQVTHSQFRSALHAGNLDRAHDMLATLEQLDPGSTTIATMRNQLGGAWLDRADDAATQGRAAAARTALQEARRLVPQDPRIGEVSARIQAN